MSNPLFIPYEDFYGQKEEKNELTVHRNSQATDRPSRSSGEPSWKIALKNFLTLPENEQLDSRAMEDVLYGTKITWEKACELFQFVELQRDVSLPPNITEEVLGKIYSGISFGRAKFSRDQQQLDSRDRTILGLWEHVKKSRMEVDGDSLTPIPGNALKQVLTCLSRWETSLSLFVNNHRMTNLEAAHLLPVISCIEDARLVGCTVGTAQMKALSDIVFRKSRGDRDFLSNKSGQALLERLIRNHAIFSIHNAVMFIDTAVPYLLPRSSPGATQTTPTAPTLFLCWLLKFVKFPTNISSTFMQLLKEKYEAPVWKRISPIDLNFAFRLLMNDRKAIWATNRDIPGSPDGLRARQPSEITTAMYRDLFSLANYCIDAEEQPSEDNAEKPKSPQEKFSSLYFHCAIFFASINHTGSWETSLKAFRKVRVPSGDLNRLTQHGRPHTDAYPLFSYIENSCRLMTSVTREDSVFPLQAQRSLFEELKSRLPLAALFACGSVARNLAIQSKWEASLKYFKTFTQRPGAFVTLNTEASSSVVACHVIHACAKNARWEEAIRVHNTALEFIAKSVSVSPAKAQYSTSASAMIGRALLSSIITYVKMNDLPSKSVKQSVHRCVTNLVENIQCVSAEKYAAYVKKLEAATTKAPKKSEPVKEESRKKTPFDTQMRQRLSFVIQ